MGVLLTDVCSLLLFSWDCILIASLCDLWHFMGLLCFGVERWDINLILQYLLMKSHCPRQANGLKGGRSEHLSLLASSSPLMGQGPRSA